MDVIKVPHLEINKFDPFEFTEKLPKEEDGENAKVNKLLDDLERKSFRDTTFEEVGLILHGMGMEKYVKLFFNEKLDLDTFLHLKLKDLNELGITDPQDQEIIMKNLKAHQASSDECFLSENHYDDLKIAKSIYSLLIMQQNYCTYLDLQMRKHHLKDYRINVKESAVTYLKAFTESALTQAQVMSQMLFNETESNHLIGKALEVTGIQLPKHLKEKLIVRKSKSAIGKLFVATGILGISVLIGRQIMNKK